MTSKLASTAALSLAALLNFGGGTPAKAADAAADSTRALASTGGPATATTSTAPAAAAISVPKLGGYLQVREAWADRVGFTATLNRARISVDGALPNHLSYRFLVEYEAAAATGAASVSLRDGYVRWALAPWTLIAGQFKTPFSREYLMSISVVETPDRATMIDSLATKRDIGVMAEYALGAVAVVSAGAFNGEGQNASANRDSTVLFVQRLTVRPIAGVSLGGSGAEYGSDSTRVGLDAMLECRGLLLRGEYLEQHRVARNQFDRGAYGLVGYRVRPWLQLVARQEEYRRPGPTKVKGLTATVGGANIDLPGRRTRVAVDVVTRRAYPDRERRTTVSSQLQVRF
jgi:Phosphate-selective porin O and P